LKPRRVRGFFLAAPLSTRAVGRVQQLWYRRDTAPGSRKRRVRRLEGNAVYVRRSPRQEPASPAHRSAAPLELNAISPLVAPFTMPGVRFVAA
jgi:hypothetical protein